MTPDRRDLYVAYLTFIKHFNILSLFSGPEHLCDKSPDPMIIIQLLVSGVVCFDSVPPRTHALHVD